MTNNNNRDKSSTAIVVATVILVAVILLQSYPGAEDNSNNQNQNSNKTPMIVEVLPNIDDDASTQIASEPQPINMVGVVVPESDKVMNEINTNSVEVDLNATQPIVAEKVGASTEAETETEAKAGSELVVRNPFKQVDLSKYTKPTTTETKKGAPEVHEVNEYSERGLLTSKELSASGQPISKTSYSNRNYFIGGEVVVKNKVVYNDDDTKTVTKYWDTGHYVGKIDRKTTYTNDNRMISQEVYNPRTQEVMIRRDF